MKKKTRKLEDHRLLVEWIDSHLLADIYNIGCGIRSETKDIHAYSEGQPKGVQRNMDNYPEDPVGTAEDYV